MEDSPAGRWIRPRVAAAEIGAVLNQEGARYLVIGGIACILHGHVRATTDLDILIERTPENAGRVLEALAQAGYGFAREWLPAEILRKPVTMIGDDPAVDIFTIAWSVKYEDAAARAVTMEVEGVVLPVIGLEDLIATKRTSRRSDALDVEVLQRILDVRRAGGLG
jgi:predicted nucleotidyltransferase